jgi:hypothetical protein
VVAQPCGLTGAFRKIDDGIAQTAPNGIQEGKQRRQQGDCSGQNVCQHVQANLRLTAWSPRRRKRLSHIYLSI